MPTKNRKTMYALAIARAVEIGPRIIDPRSGTLAYALTKNDIKGLFEAHGFPSVPRDRIKTPRPMFVAYSQDWVEAGLLDIVNGMFVFTDPSIPSQAEDLMFYGARDGVPVRDMHGTVHTAAECADAYTLTTDEVRGRLRRMRDAMEAGQ